MIHLVATLALVLAALSAPSVQAQDAAWATLARGGIGLIRHAEAPGGVGDPAGFRLDDCATQRPLSDRGRAQAAALGSALRERGIAVGRLLSSQWCRCLETARRMALGPVQDFAPLNNLFGRRELAEAQTRALRESIRAWSGPGALLMVSHGSTILALAGVNPGEGEIVVVESRSDSESGVRVVGRIPPPG
jgi:phosphohistidine phosphatase SixA